jgi:hypothetical protein
MRLTRFIAALIAGALAVAGVVALQGSPAFATANPPKANRALIGTWNNIDPGTRDILKLTITPVGGGAIRVETYGNCGTTLCDSGSVPATVYGRSATAKSGKAFSVDQDVYADAVFARVVLLGSLAASGVLTVNNFGAFTDGSGRKNYATTDKFVNSALEPESSAGAGATGLVLGNPPAPYRRVLGTWVDSSSEFLIKMAVSADPDGGLAIVATTSCCDAGSAVGVVYGSNVSATHGTKFLAQFTDAGAGPILISVSYSSRTDTLTVSGYREFSDGSGRSNYTFHESMTRAA